MFFIASMKHVERARQLLVTGDDAQLPYAALEARMAIERIFYALLVHYRDELPSDIAKKWQPRQIIAAVLSCNPMGQQHQQLLMRPKGGGEPIFVGTQSPIPPELLSKYYHRFGSYLHAPKDGHEPKVRRLRATIEAALARVEQYSKETTMIHNGGIFLQARCICGRTIKRNLFAVGVTSFARCPDEACEAVYDVQIVQGGSRWRLRLEDVRCIKCRVKTPVGVHNLKPGKGFACIGCGTQYTVRFGPILEVQDPSTPSAVHSSPADWRE